MKNPRTLIKLFLGAAIVFAILFLVSVKIVRQSENVIVTRLGKVITVIREPGLYVKYPFPIDKFITLNTRIQVYDTQKTELLTKDQKNIIVLTFVSWQIENALKFYTAVGGNRDLFLSKLDSLVNNTKNIVLGNYNFADLFIANREENKLDQIEERILSLVREKAQSLYGIRINHVGIKRLSIPAENVKAVFQQMRADRAIVASKYQEEGKIEAERIRNRAELEGAKIVSEARKKAAIIRGNAEAEAADIYAKSYRKAPQFYRMIQSLETLKKIATQQTSVILRTDSQPFDLLRKKPGNRGK